MDPSTPYLTVKEVADLLKVSNRTVYRLAKENPKWTVRVRRSLRFDKKRIESDLDPEKSV